MTKDNDFGTAKLSRRDFLKLAINTGGGLILAACAPGVVGPIMPVPDGAPGSPTPTQPAPTETATATSTATETQASADAENPTADALNGGEWGGFAFTKNAEGYYEAMDAEGNIIPELKFFEDGTAEHTAKINSKTETLTVAFQAISVGEDGQLVLGLWEYAKGAWTDAITGIAPKSSEEMKSYHKLVILEGHEKEQAMIETVFLARDQAMAKSEKYDPASEFDGISVTVNFKTIDNFDVRPKRWEIVNWSRAENGAFLFRPISPNNEVGYADDSRLAYARPMQIALDMGWFNLDIYSKDGTLQPSAVHIPIIAMNADSSITDLSGILRQSSLDKISSSFTKESRGKLFFWLLTQMINTSQYEKLDDELCAFIAGANQNQLEEGWGPKLGNGVSTPDEIWKLKSLPKELDRTFLAVFGGQ